MNAETFWDRVDKTPDCWVWTGGKSRGGYGTLRLSRTVWKYAHRYAYELTVGQIGEGLQIDHLCRNRACVRPAHLEAVSQAENVRRGAAPYGEIRKTCKHGHDITNPENVYTEPNGNRRCRVCALKTEAKRTADRRATRALRQEMNA